MPNPLTADPLTHGLWAQTAPDAPDCPPLIGETRADVAIVGAGYTGLSCALHLAEAGVSVVVLEAEAAGFGGAGRNVGLVNAGMWVQPEAVVAALGPSYGGRLLRALSAGPAEVFALIERLAIAAEARPCGTLHLAVGRAGEAEIAARCAQWQALGAPVSRLTAAETRARLGGGAYRGALLDRRAGTIQPLAYARGLARAAQAAGAQIYAGSAARVIARDGAGWRVETGAGVLRADWVLPLTDAYSAGFDGPQIAREQVLLPYFNMATAPLPAHLRAEILAGGEGCWDTRAVLTSFRMDAQGRLIFGSVGRLGGLDRAVHRAWAARAMARIFPQLQGFGFESEWWGQIGMTDDALPRLHQFGPNALAFCGYNGRGIAPGTVFGRLLAQHILGQIALKEMPLPVRDLARAPLRGVRYQGYALGAATQHLVGSRA